MDAGEKEKSLQKAAKLISSAQDSAKAKDFKAALTFYEQGIEFYSDVLSCEFSMKFSKLVNIEFLFIY